MGNKKMVVLSGAGISAESGLKTFRDAGGLWEGHDVMEVASPQGWNRNRELVLKFYNDRRRQLKTASPNKAHRFFAELESEFDLTVITQNVDDLHERAGSSKVIHLHGELMKARSSLRQDLVYECRGDIKTGDKCELGSQLRPHVVWFGEPVPMMEVAAETVSTADILVVIGSSLQVYPAAGLIGLVPDHSRVFYIDPKPQISYELAIIGNVTVIEEPATQGVDTLAGILPACR